MKKVLIPARFFILLIVAVAYIFLFKHPSLYADELYINPGESIQTAIDDASTGDVLIIQAGRYVENINFQGKGITVRSIDPDDPAVVAAAIIDGGQAGSVVTFSNSEGSGSVLSGVTIENGNASNGGGINCVSSSSPIISKCVIRGNTATSHGGGIYCYYYSSPSISNCTITGNTATSNDSGGGGIYCTSSSSPSITK